MPECDGISNRVRCRPGSSGVSTSDPEGAIHGTDVCERWAVCHLAGTDKVFFVGCLIPESGAYRSNQDVLKKMAETLGLVSS
jgi:hypothetical protein